MQADQQQPTGNRSPVVIGIDWADQKHAVCLIDPDTPGPEHSELEQTPESILAWAAMLRQRFPERDLCVVLEQARGALIHSLLNTGEFLIYPINPKQLARYREALYPSGAKDDPVDAELLANFLAHYRDRLRPWQPDQEQTRRITHLVAFRRTLVDERKRVTQRLGSTLKLYFPFVVEHFGKKLASTLVTTLLRRWPSLEALKRPHPKTLRAFLKEHGVRGEQKREDLVRAIRSAEPLTRDGAIIDTHAEYVVSLARQLEELVKSIQRFDEQLEQAVAEHDDAVIFRSLPGAGDALVPRLIAAFGSDRARYESATPILNYSGIAPIRKKTGNSCDVIRRYACPKFLRQTFHEFAEHSRRWSPWAKAWFEHKRAAGMKHHAAVRAPAYKWIRIIFRLWKNRETYSEQRYIQALVKAGSPIVPLIDGNY